jgi:alkanesulfonate monooxygenase SsuD/methylene tetrahydromethanopterin reductase-like flavin-dependent oxidoreductase (luciferase family)
VRHALYLPPFGPLADAGALAELAQAAEEGGWDGMFLWDHVLRPATDPPELADTTVCLAAMAVATERLRLGPMVTPLVRRRPQKVAREIATLDRLSGGRVTLGLGLGVDSGGELSRFGELTDRRVRGDLIDEGADLVAALLAQRGPCGTTTRAPPRPTCWAGSPAGLSDRPVSQVARARPGAPSRCRRARRRSRAR